MTVSRTRSGPRGLAARLIARDELKDRDRTTSAGGALAVGRECRQDALGEPEQPRALRLVFDEPGAKALSTELDVRVRSRLVVPEGVLGPSGVRGEDHHATVV